MVGGRGLLAGWRVGLVRLAVRHVMVWVEGLRGMGCVGCWLEWFGFGVG